MQMSIEELELNVIRALGLTIEAINGGLSFCATRAVASPAYDAKMQMHAHKLADRLEHIAQYSLEGLDPAVRRRYLSQDIAMLRILLRMNRDTIRNRFPRHLPADEALAHLHIEAGPDDLGREPAEQMRHLDDEWNRGTPGAPPATSADEIKAARTSVDATRAESRWSRILRSPVTLVLGLLSLPIAAFAGVHADMLEAGIRARDKAVARAKTPDAKAAAAALNAREFELFSEGLKPLVLVTEWDDRTGFDRLANEGRAHVLMLTLNMPRARKGVAGRLLGLTEPSTTELRFYARPSEERRLDAIEGLYGQAAQAPFTAREGAALYAFITGSQTIEDFQASLHAAIPVGAGSGARA